MQAQEMEAENGGWECLVQQIEDVSVNPWAQRSSRNGLLKPLLYRILLFVTLAETNIDPENGRLEDEISFRLRAYLSFREVYLSFLREGQRVLHVLLSSEIGMFPPPGMSEASEGLCWGSLESLRREFISRHSNKIWNKVCRSETKLENQTLITSDTQIVGKDGKYH